MKYQTLILTILAIGLALTSPQAIAQGTQRGLQIVNAWARLAPHDKSNATVYFEINNASDNADELVSVWTPVADKAQISRPKWVGLNMHMERLSSIEVSAGARIVLRPGAEQIDVTHLSQTLHPGQSIPFEVRFQRAGRVEFSATIMNKLLPDQRLLK